MAKILRNRDLGPFHDLLLEACPPMKRDATGYLVHSPDGIKSIAVLAKLLHMTPWGVNLWIKKQRIPPLKARAITELPGCNVEIEKFSPYIFGE
jgi:hypothetical protein